MAIVSYFGQHPTTILFQTSDGFNGTAQTGETVITPGLYTFPVQAGGGLYNLHNECVDVKNITFKGSGTLTISKTIAGMDATIATIGSGQGEFFENTTLSPGEALKFTCTGAAKVAVTAALASGFGAT